MSTASAPVPVALNLPRSDAARDLLANKLRSGGSTGSSKGGSAVGASAHSTTLPPLQPAKESLASAASARGSPVSQSSDGGSGARHGQEAHDTKPAAVPQPPLTPRPPPAPLTEEELQNMNFGAPGKRIVSPASMRRWESSHAFDEVLGFVMFCNDAVIGRKLSEDIHLSPAVSALMGILDRVDEAVRQTPAESGSSSRFGNPAFRTFYSRVKEQSRAFHESIPGLAAIKGKGKENEMAGDQNGQEQSDAIAEIETYFIESFGNEKRIDYGSGMELNFACWLMCLVKLRILDLPSEAPALVLRVFWRYVEVMRNVQSTYWLEPAGSHGVWGLDDYHFLPFLFGSAQLKGHKYFKPKAIHDPEILDEFSKDYMYYACIRFINSIKTASLRWHSPMLDDISGVKTWSKVNEGMVKMYKAEVLLKLPIAQHIFFGSLLRFPSSGGGEDAEEAQRLAGAIEQGGVVHEDADGRVHVHGGGAGEGAAASASGWGDCCGIPIPSAFAAAQEERAKSHGAGGLRFEGGGSGVRRIPFD